MIAIAGGLLVGLETATASVGKKDGDAPTAFADTFQKAASDAGVVTRRGVKAERSAASGRKAGVAETLQAARVGQGGTTRAARKAVAAGGVEATTLPEAEASVAGATKLVLDAGEEAGELVSGGGSGKVRVPVVPVASGLNAGDGAGEVGTTASLSAGRDTSRFLAVPLAAHGSEAAPLTVGEALQVAGAKLAESVDRVEVQGGGGVGARVALDAVTEEGAVDVAVVSNPVALKQGPVVAKQGPAAKQAGVAASVVVEGLREAPGGASLIATAGWNEVEVAPQGPVPAMVTVVDAKRVQAGTEVVVTGKAESLDSPVAGAVTIPAAESDVKAAVGELQEVNSASAKDVVAAHVAEESTGAMAMVAKDAAAVNGDDAKSTVAASASAAGGEVVHEVRGSALSNAAGHGGKAGRESLSKSSSGGESLESTPAQFASVGELKVPVDQETQVVPGGYVPVEAAGQVQIQAAPIAMEANVGVAAGDAKAGAVVSSKASSGEVSAPTTRAGEFKDQVVQATSGAVAGATVSGERTRSVRAKAVPAQAEDSGTTLPGSAMPRPDALAVAPELDGSSLPIAGPVVAAAASMSQQAPVAAVALEMTSSQRSVPVTAVKTNVEGNQQGVTSFVTKAVASSDGRSRKTGAAVGGTTATVANGEYVEGVTHLENAEVAAPQERMSVNAAAVNSVAVSDVAATDAIPMAKEGQGHHVAVGGSSTVAKERKNSVGDGKAATNGLVGTAVDNGRVVAALSPAGGVSSAEKVAGAEHRSPVSGESQTSVSVAANGEGVSSLQAHGVQTVTQNVAAPVVAVPMVVSGSSSGLETNGHAGLSTQGLAGADSLVSPMAHTTLQATPTVLEVGVPGGTHGWLKIRAEIGEGGTVQASMSAASHAGQETLRRELPGINAFLESEHVPVTVQVAHGLSGAGGSSLPDGGGMKDGSFAAGGNLSQSTDSQQGREASPGAPANGDGREQSGSRQQQNGAGIDSRGGAVRPGSAANDAEWTAPAGYGGASVANGGSWLNVMA